MKTTLVETINGPMNVIEGDMWISRSLRELGEHSYLEYQFIRMCTRMTGRKGLCVDAGAYIGDLTIPLSRTFDKVVAFEPQAEIRGILEENLRINKVTNVDVIPYALSMDDGAEMAYETDLASPGSTMMGAAAGTALARTVTLDSLNLPVDFFKADVEGMELYALHGAQETIAKHRPLLFMERDTVVTPGQQTLTEVFEILGYEAHPTAFPFFRPDNFRRAPNTFESYAALMMFGVPY